MRQSELYFVRQSQEVGGLGYCDEVSAHPRVIVGDRRLPAGFAHPHASEEARDLAERGLILRTQVGSGVHGTAIDGQDDRDEMGICLEPPEYVTGLSGVPRGIDSVGSTIPFEQYERHTVWDEAGGLANRSGAGDLDVIVYSARKWCRLALSGNPTVLLVLFVPDEEVVFRTMLVSSWSRTRIGSSPSWQHSGSSVT